MGQMTFEPEESIYRLIPEEEAPPEKQPMYRSSHNATLPPSYSTFGIAGTSKKMANPGGMEIIHDISGGKHKARKPHASMGATVNTTVNPKNYLKMAGRRELPPASKFLRSETERRPPVPGQTEKPVMGLTTDKNFVVSNAVDNILAAPKKQDQPIKNMTQTKTFGKTPSYLKKVKREVEGEKQMLTQQAQNAADPLDVRLRLLTEQEKRNLISSLKQKWEQLNKSYQSLTFSMDTVSKVHRKEQQEALLEKLERAVQKVSNKRCVFVYDDVGGGFDALGIQGCDPRLAKDL
ncbi:hypothetical protein DIPPA_21809 [Diplonema papillatum]|nr:hypothetical protein DIPPA_21809 [Diplonema papillatum]